MATRYKIIIILLILLIFCIANIQATAPRLQATTHDPSPSSQTNSLIIRPTPSPSTEPPNHQLSAYASPPPPDPHLSKARALIRAFLATPPSTHLSNSIVIINSYLAAARDTYVAALPHLQTQARIWLDLCKKNFRYLQAAREHERRLIAQSQQEPPPPMIADGEPPPSSSREFALSITSTRSQSIAAVAALAEIEPRDVLTVVLWLEEAVRAAERFQLVQMPGYVEVAGRVWRGFAPTMWVDALYARVKTGVSVAAFAVGVVVLLGAWMNKGVRWLMMGVLVVMLLLSAWMDEGW
ncbi:MAG: hypothetical protein Q9161_008436 [Pseudevernia consocians]